MHKRVLAVAVMFLVSVVLTNGGTGVSSAAGKKETSKTESVRSQEPQTQRSWPITQQRTDNRSIYLTSMSPYQKFLGGTFLGVSYTRARQSASV